MSNHYNRGDLQRLGQCKREYDDNINPVPLETNEQLFEDIGKAVRKLIADAKGKEDEWLLEWRMYPSTGHHDRDVDEKGHGCGCGCGCGE